MVGYTIVYTKRAVSDIDKLKAAKLAQKALNLIGIIRENPYKTPPTLEKLKGDLLGVFLRRINLQHRLIYQVAEEEKTIKIIRLWTRYE